MDNHRKLPALLEEQLAKIREEARRKLEAELDARRACECAKLAKSRFIPLEEAWFLYGLNPDPEWIKSRSERGRRERRCRAPQLSQRRQAGFADEQNEKQATADHRQLY